MARGRLICLIGQHAEQRRCRVVVRRTRDRRIGQVERRRLEFELLAFRDRKRADHAGVKLRRGSVVLRVGLETRKRAVRAPRPIHPLSTTGSGLVNTGMAAALSSGAASFHQKQPEKARAVLAELIAKAYTTASGLPSAAARRVGESAGRFRALLPWRSAVAARAPERCGPRTWKRRG